MDITYYDV